jgi:hypothetical protein
LEARIVGLETDAEKSESDKNTSEAVGASEESELRNLRNKLAIQEACAQQLEVQDRQ